MRGERIGQLLVRDGVISEEQLDRAKTDPKGSPLARRLVELGYASERQIASSLAAQMGLPFVDLNDLEIDAAAATLIKDSLARRYKILPIGFEDEALIVAMADPTNVIAVDDLRIATGYEIKPVVTCETELMAAIDRFCAADMMEEVVDSVDEDLGETEVAEESDADDAPIVKLVTLMLTEAARARANDVHVEPEENDIRIRYRIDGVLHEIMRSPKRVQAGVISRLKILAGMDIAQRRVPQDGRFSLTIDKKAYDFRVATLQTIHGEKVVLRLLEKESVLIQLDDLGFSPESLDRFKSSFTKPYGAIFVCGPTGSGKTTTLYAALNVLNALDRNLITVEDPVEYRLASLNQVQINSRAGLTFAEVLRSILRHDPDIIMIGEVRDAETALMAIESALTGHLVLTTLHTNDAPSALTRLTEMEIEPFLISSAVDCVVSQRLARRLCLHCRERYEPAPDLLADIGLAVRPGEQATFYRPRGCRMCSNTGYKGRVGLFETLLVTPTIARLTVDRAGSEELLKAAIGEGMRPLRSDGFEKIKRGMTSIEEILRVTL